METERKCFPFEIVNRLRKGEKILCTRCKKGYLEPIGDYKVTNSFICKKCGNQLIQD